MNTKMSWSIAVLVVFSVIASLAIPATVADGDRAPPDGENTVYSWAPGYCTVTVNEQSMEHLGDDPNPQMSGPDDTANIDQTGVSWTLNDDGTLDITVKVWTDGWGEYLNVWIDWDGSMTFDTDEQVVDHYQDYPFGYTTQTFSGISIPPEAVGRTTYLRAVLSWDMDADSCDSWSYGDVEDYEITFPDEVIPEFSTIAIPVASILGLLFFFNYRKRRKE